jgi:hypothetical protein
MNCTKEFVYLEQEVGYFQHLHESAIGYGLIPEREVIISQTSQQN